MLCKNPNGLFAQYNLIFYIVKHGTLHGFSRQEYWNGLPFPTPGDLPELGIELESPAWKADSLPLSYLGSPAEPTGLR